MTAATDTTPVTTANTQADPALAGAAPYELSQEKMFKDTFVFLFLMFAIFYILLIRPQQKRLKAHQALMKDMKKGDKIVTGGGVMGTIIKLEGDDVVLVEIAPNVRVRVARGTISEKLNEDTLAASNTANDN